jgi:hypothetical protein
VYALLNLARRFGSDRTNKVCRLALDADMLNVHKLRKMLEAPQVIDVPRRMRTAMGHGLPAQTIERPETDQFAAWAAANRYSLVYPPTFLASCAFA